MVLQIHSSGHKPKKTSQIGQVLDCLTDAHKAGMSCTVMTISQITGITHSNIHIFLRRLRKWHVIDETGSYDNGGVKLFTYIGTLAQIENSLAKKEMREKAVHLLKAMNVVDIETIQKVLNISTPDALELMAYLVRSGVAMLHSTECKLALI